VAFTGVGLGVCFFSDLTTDFGFYSDFTADLGLVSDLTADLGLVVDGCSYFFTDAFLGDGEETLGVGERPRASSFFLLTGSVFMTTSSSDWTKPHALTFFGEDLADFTAATSVSLTAEASSIEGSMSFLADYFALCFLAEAAPLSFLSAEALIES
jgi:hypothetical protein